MKTRSIPALLLAVLYAPAGAVCAQAAGDASHVPPAMSVPSPRQVAAMLSSKLSLSETQMADVARIIAERQQKTRSVLAEPTVNRLERRRKIREVFGDTDARINAALTHDQRIQYAEIEKSLREQMRQYTRQ